MKTTFIASILIDKAHPQQHTVESSQSNLVRFRHERELQVAVQELLKSSFMYHNANTGRHFVMLVIGEIYYHGEDCLALINQWHLSMLEPEVFDHRMGKLHQ